MRFLPLALATALSLPAALKAEQGISSTQILLGQSAALSGTSGALGQEFRAGAIQYFKAVNDSGGIHGRHVKLLSLDDKYEPSKALKNTERLIKKNKVFALFGYIGTPTSKTVLPLVKRYSVPFIAPVTGAQALRQPFNPKVFNIRASYHKEAAKIINYLADAGWTRVAVLYQNDGFGKDGLEGIVKAMATRGLKPIISASVERNSLKTTDAARIINNQNPDAVIMISTYGPVASFVNELHAMGSKSQLMAVSFVGTKPLFKALKKGHSNSIGVSQVVPFPWNSRIPIVKEYQRILRHGQPTTSFGFSSLEGFIAAKVVVEALRRAGPNPSRADFIQAMESLHNYQMGGFKVDFSTQQHNGSNYVDLTFLGSQEWQP